MPRFLDFSGQGWLQLGELTLAFVLSALVGVEREIRQKSAGLRTHTLVGVSAALIMLISKYGFMDVLSNGRVVLDPSRVAAQVVSGIGFIGGGVIFMRRDVVRGLTTAASIWFTAALGMACGAGLPVLAAATTIGHFVIMLGFPKMARQLPRSRRLATEISISYEDGRELLRAILIKCTELRFAINHVRLDREAAFADSREEAMDRAYNEGGELGWRPEKGTVTMRMQVKGKRPISHLISALSSIGGVHEVGTVNDDTELD
ncbi:MgtC/SapB family protein [Acidisphaera sp. S103]|uniref:MgtC/SapB family protein n=1 Tax=Acidisphaera sp. S103 TaxID=1747223 RepID=UPI00131D5AB9|nr:MgtC/SapB family protein [Acidisphaera sp. S103]